MEANAMGRLWVDNDVLNYWCKANCLEEILHKVPYTLCTTELVRWEAEKGGAALQDALVAMDRGVIFVHPLGVPPLDCALQGMGALSPADESLLLCAQQLGGEVLTNDRTLINRCAVLGVGCKPFTDFLREAASQRWLSSATIEVLRALCNC
jgi:hypothetical protein